MKLASFELEGRAAYGAVRGDAVLDLSARFADRWPDLRALLAADGVAAARDALAEGGLPEAALDAVRLLPPIPNPGRILCVGLNYDEHRRETGRPELAYPTLFVRFSSTLVGHGAPLVVPRESSRLDFEGELAVVIGRGGRRIAAARALEHVAGYSCFNDATVRDWQRHTSQFTPGKNFPATGGFGPWLVTADQIPDPAALTLSTRLNGERMQHATTASMIFPVPALIEYISSFTRLDPGDVIATGTPGGVGFKREPPLYLKPGDAIEVEIDRIGTLANPARAEPGGP